METLKTSIPAEPAVQRRIARVVTAPPPAPGFIGEGHTAVEVVRPDALAETDPFVLLMDDRLDLGEPRVVGGAHPHAGLEVVTLLLEGAAHDRDEGVLSAGDAAWMTAGRGIIHNEHVMVGGRARILQLWIRLSSRDRRAAPGFEVIRRDTLPVRREAGAEVRLYSGSTGGLTSPTRNHVPVTLVDVELQRGASVEQHLPASYHGFLYVLRGAVRPGDGAALSEGQVGWLDHATSGGDSVLRLTAGEQGGRAVLYAGEPQREPIIHRGPFVADSEEDLMRMFHDYRAGRFTPLSRLSHAASR